MATSVDGGISAAGAQGPHVRISGLTKRFEAFQALGGIDLDIARGELMTLLGPSGCGKTTLLRTVAGFLRNDGGSISVGGRVIDDLAPHKRNFGMVFQSYAIFPHLSVKDNVAYGLKARGVSGKELTSRVMEALASVKLEALAERFPDAMSGGQKQRVGLARAMVIKPELLLMDEPLSNLDAKLRIEMRQEIRLMQKQLGITTLYVTHDQEEAMAISDRVAVMDRGTLQQVAAPEAIYDNPVNAFVTGFIGGCNWFDGQIIALDSGLGLALAGEAPVLLPATAGLTPGQMVRLAMRTEDFTLAGGPDCAISGTVLIRSYLGQRTRLRLRHAAGGEFDVDLPSAPGLPSEREVAHLGFLPGRTRLFAADDGRRLV